jgi:adenosylcobyric acid synthase
VEGGCYNRAMAAARTLMVQGTASSVGKSLLVTGLCRYFRNKGLKVAPFKALNMALNAHVTRQGFELARAQAVQAEACGIEPLVEMNPVLLKPEGNARSQVVLLGKAAGVRSARELFHSGLDVRGAALDALGTLRSQFDLIVIEGAGSPAEINLRARDVANMFTARAAEAPVLLAGDIDRGGVLAAFVGTLELLEPEDRERVKALWVNKFRGDLSLLTPGLEWLTQRTGKPVLGVLPHLGRLRLAEEDSLDVDARAVNASARGALQVAVLRLPRISNHDEFQPFEHEPEVGLEFVEDVERALAADLLIVPGTKSTLSDLAWLRERGLDHVIALRVRLGRPVLGICGGCQMLGDRIADPHGVESTQQVGAGLGLLPLVTEFQREKRTLRVQARLAGRGGLFAEVPRDLHVPGYFIHAGVTSSAAGGLFEVREEGGAWRPDGAADADSVVLGTMVHGLFEHDGLRHAVLDRLRAVRGLSQQRGRVSWDREAEYEKLARAIAEHSDTALLDRLALG